jgi:prolyl-tRNA synthetase
MKKEITLVRRDNIERKITINLESSEAEKAFLRNFETNLAENLEKHNLEDKKKEQLTTDHKGIIDSVRKGFKRDKIIKVIKQEIVEFKKNLYQKSVDFRDKHIFPVVNFSELEKKMKAGTKGLFLTPFCNRLECEMKIKEKVLAHSIRCISEKEKMIPQKSCLFCQSPAQNMVYLGRSY